MRVPRASQVFPEPRWTFSSTSVVGADFAVGEDELQIGDALGRDLSSLHVEGVQQSRLKILERERHGKKGQVDRRSPAKREVYP